MEKKLSVGERLIILQILPKEGNFVTLRLLRELTSKVGLTSEELVEFEVKQEGDIVTWNEKGKEERPIDFKVKEVELIATALNKLDSNSKLEFQHYSIFEKFVADEDLGE